MSKKKLYFQLTTEDYSAVMKLSGCLEWIKNDCDLEKVEPTEYIITPVWLTTKEFNNLPEAD